MEINKPKLLIVGDSFFSVDHHYYGNTFPKWKGHHWSEIIADYEVLNCAQPGSSNGMVHLELLTQLARHTDISAIAIGFTSPIRIEFKNTKTNQHDFVFDEYRYFTTAHEKWLNNDQKLLKTLYRSLVDDDLESFKGFWTVLGTLYFLKNLNILFVYSLGFFEKDLSSSTIVEQHLQTIMSQFSQFEKNKINFNLTTYPEELYTSSDPVFHVPDPTWQQKFANEVVTKLKMIDTQSDSLL